MMSLTKRVLAFFLSFALILGNTLPVYATTETNDQGNSALMDVQSVTINSGSVYDLTTNDAATSVLGLTEGTIFVEFQTTSMQQHQSLFSVSNPTTNEGNMYRHFHIYITPTGTLGMELRNTDTEFKYTLSADNVLTTDTNKIAFKADATAKDYKLFANGEMVGVLSKEDFKFFADITGITTISLGGTIRNQEVGYPFGGIISHAAIYATPMSDEELIALTAFDTEPEETTPEETTPEETTPEEVNPLDTILIDESNISIVSGAVYDLSSDENADSVYALTEGTVIVEFSSSSAQNYQSLFSVSNPLTDDGCMYRHFHLYITPTGTLGMELRNTDSEFKYTMAHDHVLNTDGTNKVAFKADATAKNYKLFANGSLVGELSKEDFKFFNDITGLGTISLGGTIRNQNVGYPFGGTITTAKVYGAPLTDETLISMTSIETEPDTEPEENIGLLLDKNNITIEVGSYQDLSNELNADRIMALTEGTIVMSFTSTSTNGVQSLISIGNGTSGNNNRHFHLYITNTGILGMELRNTDSEFKYTLNRPAALEGKNHGQAAINTIAFKADKDAMSYKLFANGELLATLSTSDWKFISDITGINNIALGSTIRGGSAAYPYEGTISNVKIYDTPLSDEELLLVTSATTYGSKIFYAGDGTGSNYYRIPTLLTLASGNVVSSIDARYGGTHDARSNIDIAFARSTDGGVTWSSPTLPLVFDDYAPQTIDWLRDDTGKNVQIGGSASFIDTVLLQDHETGRLFLFADAFTSGKGFNNCVGGTGYKEINGEKYLKLHWYEDAEGVYNYTIRDNGVIYNDTTNTATDYSVDGNYRIKYNGQYLTQKQYRVRWSGTTLIEEKTDIDVNMCVFYKDSVFNLLPTNYLVMKYSDNEGATWSDMTILGKFRDVDDRMVLFGPGVGTQIKNGTYAGRLLISAYNSVSGEYGYLYSDDHGTNWSFIATDLGEGGSFAEAQIIEFPDGSLRTYMRTSSGKIGYITSIDGGMTWTTQKFIDGITVASYGTQLSAINYSQKVNGKDVILLSTPTASGGRRAGKILVGVITDTGNTGHDRYTVSWDYQYEIDYADYGFSYSCMTELPDHRIGILYEKYDSWSRSELHLKDIMKYDIFTIDELTA